MLNFQTRLQLLFIPLPVNAQRAWSRNLITGTYLIIHTITPLNRNIRSTSHTSVGARRGQGGLQQTCTPTNFSHSHSYNHAHLIAMIKPHNLTLCPHFRLTHHNLCNSDHHEYMYSCNQSPFKQFLETTDPTTHVCQPLILCLLYLHNNSNAESGVGVGDQKPTGEMPTSASCLRSSSLSLPYSSAVLSWFTDLH